MMFPLVARAFGIIASIVGILYVHMDKEEKIDPMTALNRGYYVAVVLALAAFGGATYWLLSSRRGAPTPGGTSSCAASSGWPPRWPSSTSPSTTPSTSTAR